MILKLKRTPGIYLVGFMGCGKTTIGKLLAEEIGWPFADLDDDIERHAGASVQEIFAQRGEREFRTLESEALQARLRTVECGQPLVMALGGGAFVQPGNFAALERSGVSLFLDAPLAAIEKRIALDGSRPLARDAQSLRHLYEARRPQYLLADFHVAITDEDPRRNLAAVLRLPLFE